jgi:hypothetical protein
MKFDELAKGEKFKIDSPRSTGALYIKIKVRHLEDDDGWRMLEIATCDAFPPTKSEVVKVT